jgi:hypothetical protein
MEGGSTRMPSRCAFRGGNRELVRVVEVERHGRRQELDGWFALRYAVW